MDINVYFAPEIIPLAPPDHAKNLKKYITSDFEEKRLIGENDEYICQLIRKDLIEEFISYIKKNDISINTHIQRSIFETNKFLFSKSTSLVEYAAFFGSIQIFRYLILNKVWITNDLLLYSIHGDNPEIISIVEEFYNVNNNYYFKSYINESIKCHHNDITRYLQDNNPDYNDALHIYKKCLQYYNFAFITKDAINESTFYSLCKYDYYILVEYVLNNMDIDINKFVFIVIFIFIQFLKIIFIKFTKSFIFSNKIPFSIF